MDFKRLCPRHSSGLGSKARHLRASQAPGLRALTGAREPQLLPELPRRDAEQGWAPRAPPAWSRGLGGWEGKETGAGKGRGWTQQQSRGGGEATACLLRAQRLPSPQGRAAAAPPHRPIHRHTGTDTAARAGHRHSGQQHRYTGAGPAGSSRPSGVSAGPRCRSNVQGEPG